jgi:hypothetical protein
MENKIKSFLVSFNGELENSNRYCNLQYSDDGFVKAISFPELHLFDDDNDDVHYVEELSLSRLVKTLSEVLAVGKAELSVKVNNFFTEKKKQLKEKFPKIKVSFIFLSSIKYITSVSGEYDEDKLIEALDVIKQDFEYIFEGCKLDVNI